MHTRTVRWMTTGSVPAGPSPGLVSLRAPSPLFVLASTVFDQVPIATPTSRVPRSGQRNAVSSPFIPRLGPASIKCLLGPLINIPACHYVHVSVRSHSLISSLSIEPPNNYQSRAPTSHPAQPLPAPSETPHQSISLARQIRFPINTLTKNDAPSCSATPHPTCGASATVTRVSEVVIKCASRPRRIPSGPSNRAAPPANPGSVHPTTYTYPHPFVTCISDTARTLVALAWPERRPTPATQNISPQRCASYSTSFPTCPPPSKHNFQSFPAATHTPSRSGPPRGRKLALIDSPT